MHVEPILKAIADEFRTGQCLRDIAKHWACHPTVPGPGMRAAGEFLVGRYMESGLTEARLVPYPADDRTEFLGGHRNPLEWRPRSALLDIIAPEPDAYRVCCYADEPLCLVGNSHSTPPEGIEAELVVTSGPLLADRVVSGQWEGKVVLCDQFPSAVMQAVHKGGAVGLVSDCICPPWLKEHPPIRQPEDVPDLVMWTTLPGKRGDPPLFGFNLSPRQGRRLRLTAANADRPVRLQASVDAELIEGASDLVEAVLPGTDLAHQEIWVLGHLSEPGARDNASGCCVCLELARVLKTLTENGSLPPLRRTIRFLHAAEVNGYLPYLHERQHELGNVVAGLCADSVAQDFGACGGAMVFFRSPEQNASFTDGLTQLLLETVAEMPGQCFSADHYAGFPWRTEPFFGNDAFIADGFFDVPTPQVSAWPDRYYHSNLDTVDQISPSVLGRSAAVMGAFLHVLSSAGEREGAWLAGLAAQDWKVRICTRVRDAFTVTAGGERTLSGIHHLGLQAEDAVEQCRRLAPGSAHLADCIAGLVAELSNFAALESGSVAAALGLVPPEPSEPMTGAAGLDSVPKRLRWKYPSRGSMTPGAAQALDDLASSHGLDPRRVWPWINGRRTVGEILARLQFGGRALPEALLGCLELFQRERLVSDGRQGLNTRVLTAATQTRPVSVTSN